MHAATIKTVGHARPQHTGMILGDHRAVLDLAAQLYQAAGEKRVPVRIDAIVSGQLQIG